MKGDTVNLLLAEDEDLSSELLERILHPILTRFDVATTLRDTMFKAQENKYDIILLDLRLLDSDADQTIASIGTLKRISGSPVLIVTGMPQPGLKQRCMEAGATGFLPKMEAYQNDANALFMAVYTVVMHNPPKDNGFMDRVRVLEALVKAA